MRWEKRVQTDAGVQIADVSHATHMPISFQFDATTQLLQFCDLTTLATIWRQVDGMHTCLVAASPCLCIHIDRCVEGPTGIYKCLTRLQSDDEVFLPVFADETVAYDHVGYRVIAMMAHLGSDLSGHYRSALRVTPMVVAQTNPISWLLCDDWRTPEAVWTLPPWFENNITVVWLLRTDVVHLHVFQRSEPENSTATMLRLLAQTPSAGAQRKDDTHTETK